MVVEKALRGSGLSSILQSLRGRRAERGDMWSCRTCFFVDMYVAFSKIYTQERDCRITGCKQLNFSQNIYITLQTAKFLQLCMRVSVLLHLHRTFSCFPTFSCLPGIKWYVAPVGISVLSYHFEHLFRNSLAFWVSLVNPLFIAFAHFLVCFLLFFWLIYRNYLNNLLINHLLVLDFAKVFPPKLLCIC